MCVMKLNKYFMMGAMGLSLVACSDNLDENGQGANGTNPNEGTTYVAFTVDFKGTESRTISDKGTDAERNVTTAYVMLVDGGKITAVVSKANVTTSGQGYHSDEDKYLFQTTEGTHSFYAVINPDVVPTAGKSIDEYFNTAVPMGVEDTDGIAEADDFMMSSVEDVTFYVNDGIAEDDALAGAQNDEATNNVTVTVERVAAKVTVTAASNSITGDAGGTITNTKFYLNGGATMSTRMAQAQAEIEEIQNNAWTYESGERDVHIGSYTDGEPNEETPTVEPAYCLENLHTAYTQGNTTYVTISTTFTPAKVVDCADEIKPLKDNSTTGTFYVVTAGELSGNYIMASDLTNYQNGDNQKLPAGVDAISGAYNGGACWFGPVWINLNDDATESPIVRNTWYNLNITSIKLPGEPEKPTIDDPTWPLVPPTNVAVTLTIQPWNIVNHEVELK